MFDNCVWLQGNQPQVMINHVLFPIIRIEGFPEFLTTPIWAEMIKSESHVFMNDRLITQKTI
jgi:hypothetical protein